MLPSRTQLPAIVLLFTINSLISPAAAQDTPHSQLWGTAGEAWSPASRLPDFSYAGYHFGEVPLPVYPVTANVKDFGAQGDGQTDDTEAFKQAIAQTEQGAILIPAGHYVISDILWLKKPNLVLRGEGSNATVLQITTELEDVRPNMGATTSGKATSNYSWSGGFLWLKGQEKSKPLSAIVSESARGGRQFVLESAAGIELGQRVALRMTDDAQKTLLSHLYSEDSGDTDEITRPVSVDMICRVVAVEANRITLDRPARWDVRQAWKPRLTTSPSVYRTEIYKLRRQVGPKLPPSELSRLRKGKSKATSSVLFRHPPDGEGPAFDLCATHARTSRPTALVFVSCG